MRGGWANEQAVEENCQALFFSHFCTRATHSITMHAYSIYKSQHTSYSTSDALSLYVFVISSIAVIAKINEYKVC